MLPEFINPVRLVRKNASLKGSVPLAMMPRLMADALGGGDNAMVDLNFVRDESGIPVISGCVNATILFQCQRCLKPVDYELEVGVSLGLVRDEGQEENLPDRYEPLVVAESDVSLYGLVEHELLLALPIVAYHEGCQTVSYDGGRKSDNETGSNGIVRNREKTQTTRDKPFSVLADFKDKLKSSDH